MKACLFKNRVMVFYHSEIHKDCHCVLHSSHGDRHMSHVKVIMPFEMAQMVKNGRPDYRNYSI